MEKKLQCGMIIALFFASLLVLVSCTAVYTNAAGQEVDASYTISYNLNGGSWADGYTAATSFTASTAVTLPGSDSVVYSGYTFGGWYTDSAFTGGNEITGWSAGEKTADVTVYAKWTAITYTISFDKNGGTGTAMADMTCTYDVAQNLTANTYTRIDYTFSGWNTKTDYSGDTYTDEASVINLTAVDGEIVTLYAKWTEKGSYAINYTMNSGSWVSGYTAPTSFKESDSVTLPTSSDFTRTGYTFGGWYTDSAFTGGNEITGWSAGEKTADVTVYAKWTAITYTIAYDANNSSASGATGSQSCTYGTEYTIAANGFTLTGYSFTGWNTAADGTGTSYAAGDIVTNLSATAGTTITLYAKWTVNKIESITVSAPTYSGTDLNLTSSTSGTTTTFSVDSGYASYVWLYEGTVMQSSSSNTWALDRSGSSPTVTTGKHQILVIATAAGSANSYSASCTYTYTVTE